LFARPPHPTTTTATTEDLYGGNLKLILGLLWSMFRALRLTQLANELGDAGKSGSEAQQLIAWVQKQVEPAPYQLKVNAFDQLTSPKRDEHSNAISHFNQSLTQALCKVGDWSDFRDGKAFAALLNLYDDKFLDYKTVGDDGLANLERAFKVTVCFAI
jgi:hypothetical protein